MQATEPIVRGAILQELLVAARYGLEVADGALRAAGVEPREYGSLSFVGTLQPVTRSSLARAMGVRRTTVRDVVARLIERGHVEEYPNPRDGRSTLLTLTPAGQDIYDRGLPAFQRVLHALDAALDGGLDEHENAVRRIRVVLQQLGEHASLGDEGRVNVGREGRADTVRSGRGDR
jgi:MarR family transcriptional regulator for hemolysin